MAGQKTQFYHTKYFFEEKFGKNRTKIDQIGINKLFWVILYMKNGYFQKIIKYLGYFIRYTGIPLPTHPSIFSSFHQKYDKIER